MVINFLGTFKTLQGKEIPDGAPDAPALTLRTIAGNVLSTDHQGEGQVLGDEKQKRWKLARKIYDADEVNLTVEEVALIKKLIALMYGPLITGQAWEMLEGEPGEPKTN